MSTANPYNEIRSAYGNVAAFQWYLDRLAKKVSGLKIIRLIWLDVGRLGPLEPAPGFDCRFLKPDEVQGFAGDPRNDLSTAMADRAAAGKDLCFAAVFRENGRLAAYGWYALECVESNHNFGVAMSYPADVAYMYKGFTHPDFRGKRLHGLLMGMALQGLGAHGVTKLVSTVAWTNFASLRSCERLGYVDLGVIVSVGSGEGTVLYAPSAGKRLGVRFGKRAARRPGV